MVAIAVNHVLYMDYLWMHYISMLQIYYNGLGQ